MSRVSNRHEGDADGQLVPWAERRDKAVQIIVGDTSARVAVQHTAWMLVNLLARMDGVVRSLHISARVEAPLADRVVPTSRPTDPPTDKPPSLLDALLAGAEEIDIVPTAKGLNTAADLLLEVGPGAPSPGALRVHGDGWAGGISAGGALPASLWSALPFGPYTAACLAAGRVFLLARAPGIADEEDLIEPLVWTAWSLRGGSADLLGDGPAAVTATLDAGLAGVGAVGSAAMHVIWATLGLDGGLLAVDGDRRGIDVTNLNRGVLFTRPSVGEPKAAEAAGRLAGSEISFHPVHGRYEDQPERPCLLLSAVDTNRAREVLQAQYPARVVGASTHGLRAELIRTGPAGIGVCLRCFNVPEGRESDAELRARVRDAAPDELAGLAKRAGVSVEDARHWAAEGGCGAVDRAMLETRGENDEAEDADGEFAVAFVSAFAGILLAAEAVKESLGAATPLNDSANRVTFQFLRPRAVRGPHFARRDAECPACGPGPARDIWEKRRAAGGPRRG